MSESHTPDRHEPLVIAAEGELDIATAPPMRDRVIGEIGDEPRRVVLDLREVTFIDSTALKALIDVQRHVDAQSGYLALAAGDGPVKRLIEMAVLQRRLPVFEDVDAAKAALEG